MKSIIKFCGCYTKDEYDCSIRMTYTASPCKNSSGLSFNKLSFIQTSSFLIGPKKYTTQWAIYYSVQDVCWKDILYLSTYNLHQILKWSCALSLFQTTILRLHYIEIKSTNYPYLNTIKSIFTNLNCKVTSIFAANVWATAASMCTSSTAALVLSFLKFRFHW